ncbi:MAG: NAD(P)-dependent oxidoreductase [Hyphomicrobiaceae bacterium]
MEPQRIGLVGVGNMGAPMARCLVKSGHPVMLYDTRAAVVEPLVAETDLFSAAPDLPTLGRQCNVVVTMLPDSKVVRRAAMGEDGKGGFASTLARGSVVVDMSSSYPLDTVKLGEELAARGVALVDAPVSGGVPRAVTGELAIMVGGNAAEIDRIAPMLEAMGKVHRTGKLGSGHAMKALNNYVSAAGLIATSEALVVGRSFGLDPEQMVEILNASSGRNNTTENKAKRYMLSRKFDSGFALALMEKDVGMARRLADEISVPAGELAFVSDLLGRVMGELEAGADHTAVYRWVEHNAQSKA